MTDQPDPTGTADAGPTTLAELVAEYRANADMNAANAAESEAAVARGWQTTYNHAQAKVCRREAADWTALAELVTAADALLAVTAPHSDHSLEAAYAAAGGRLAARLETP